MAAQYRIGFMIVKKGYAMQRDMALNLEQVAAPTDVRRKYGYMTVWNMRNRILNHDGLWVKLCEHRFVYADIVVRHPDVACNMLGISLSW